MRYAPESQDAYSPHQTPKITSFNCVTKTRHERLEGTRTGTFGASRIKEESCASNTWSNDGTCSSAIKQKPVSINVAAHIRNNFGIKQEVEEDQVARKRSETTAEELDGEIEVIARYLNHHALMII